MCSLCTCAVVCLPWLCFFLSASPSVHVFLQRHALYRPEEALGKDGQDEPMVADELKRVLSHEELVLLHDPPSH